MAIANYVNFFFSYLGKGLIPAPPKVVFEAVKNPQTRFTYDEMLKVRTLAIRTSGTHWNLSRNTYMSHQENSFEIFSKCRQSYSGRNDGIYPWLKPKFPSTWLICRPWPKRIFCRFHEMSVNNFRWSLWRYFRQNDDISFSVLGAFRTVNVRTCLNQLPDVLDINLSTRDFHDDVIKWNNSPRYWPLCGEFTGTGEFPTQRPVTRSCDVRFDLRLNKRLSKQS